MAKNKLSFVEFFLLWAKRQRWDVPDIHIIACHWLENRGNLAVLRCFRGFGKSTILAVYNAWRFYNDPTYRILHQSETDGTAYKTSRDTQNVIRKHPLTYQVRELAIKYNIPCVVIETNGAGGFVPPILRKALQGTGCAVRECNVRTNKQDRILSALEPPLLSSFLYAHKDVLASKAIEQMRSFNPEATTQRDDYLDSVAGAILETPVRIARQIFKNSESDLSNNWRPTGGVHEVQADY